MIVKEMPERVWCFADKSKNRWSKESFYENTVEYVRADIVSGDPNEPLEEGQYRWIKEHPGQEWGPARVWEGDCSDTGSEDYLFSRTGSEEENLCIHAYKIGPVIQPPED